MQRQDKEKWPEDFEPETRRGSRPGSRRNSTSSSRRGSIKCAKKQEIPSSSSSPKKYKDESQNSTFTTSSPKKYKDESHNSTFTNSSPKKYKDESQNSTFTNSSPKKYKDESQNSTFTTSSPKKYKDESHNSTFTTSSPKKYKDEPHAKQLKDTTPKKCKDTPTSKRQTDASTQRLKNEIQVATSNQSTPRKCQPDLFVSGKQILRKSNRANSLPTTQRRPSTDSNSSQNKSGSYPKTKISRDATKNNSQSSKSRETSLEDDMTLDLSQMSDLEEHEERRLTKKIGLATSTPKICPKPYQKPRSGSLQSQRSSIMEKQKSMKSTSSITRSTVASRDSLYKTSSTCSGGRYTNRSTTELEYSSVSPEYSTQSSCDASPRTSFVNSDVAVISPYSQRSQLSGSSCYLSWVESSHADKKTTKTEKGEWNNFWVNYNNSLSHVPVKQYYEPPTPSRLTNEDITFEDLNLNETEVSHEVSNEGLTLTPRETQHVIKCAHLLGNVLSKAIDRTVSVKVKTTVDTKDAKQNLKLDLKETEINKPLEREIKLESVTTQTDISLPNTKSAPKIFENILRQLSKTSLDISDRQKNEEASDKNKDK